MKIFCTASVGPAASLGGVMARLLTFSLALIFPVFSAAQDSAKLARLELDVRQLQREVSTLSQLVNQLRARIESPPLSGPVPTPTLPASAAAVTAPNPADSPLPRWVSASRWRNLRPGMSELEVIGELGPPSSTRGQQGERVLLYALELGAATFLAGSVTLRDRVVTAVETPILR